VRQPRRGEERQPQQVCRSRPPGPWGGTLRSDSWKGFVAQARQHFDLLDCGSSTSRPSSIDASGLKTAAGTALDLSQLYTQGEIAVVAVPEPPALGMWAAGLAGMLRWRRRAAARC
jgi:hypothetical protein